MPPHNESNHIYKELVQICSYLDEKQSFIIHTELYKSVTDYICINWDYDTAIAGMNFPAKKIQTLEETCFLGNHIYVVLKHFGIGDEQLINVTDAGWEIGALDDLLKHSNHPDDLNNGCFSTTDTQQELLTTHVYL